VPAAGDVVTVGDGLTAGVERGVGAGATVVGAGVGAAAGGVEGNATASPIRHLSTYAFSVILAPWYAALLALHSS
jgi:hypothetical protein